jgi:hypothetical protein
MSTSAHLGFSLVGPFTTREAYAAGVTRDRLKGRGFRQLFAGVHLGLTPS